ncbi:MAG: hypothetical protein E7292_08020 [Lachnospiraceae bacterium]|nr:hypothetical protein [Lachnospiraceae bacterium]
MDKIRLPGKCPTYTLTLIHIPAKCQNPYNIPTATLQKPYTFALMHLAGGVAFSKYNFEKFKGIGMLPNKLQSGKVYTFALLAGLRNWRVVRTYALLATLVI